MTEPNTVAIDALRFDPLNPRTISDLELAHLSHSLAEFGFVQPVVARRSDNLVIGGHQRIEAARRLGWTEVPVLWWEGNDRAARALNLALNKIQGDWDNARLADVLAELASVESLNEALLGFDTTLTSLAGFDTSEVLALLGSALKAEGQAEDLAAVIRRLSGASSTAARSQVGELWQLGPHRVICGDAQDPEVVHRLCEGLSPGMLFTDPPYNVGYRAETDGAGSASSGRPVGRRKAKLGQIKGDALDDKDHHLLVSSALANASRVLAPGSAVYVCGGTTNTSLYDEVFVHAGLLKASILIWDKGEFAFGRRDYQSQYELIYYGWKRGEGHRFFGGRAQTDIWTIPRDPAAFYVHPTQKPVALAKRAISNSTAPGEAVLDLFGGSGSTVIAAEQTGRRALVVELDPRFIDVILARWEAVSGQEARRSDCAALEVEHA